MGKREHRRGMPPRTRRLIAIEAARSMIEDEISQYLTAKKRAAKTVLRGGWARPSDLPSNGEIREEIRRQTSLAERHNEARLFAMRLLALQVMEDLPFQPRLIGSVWSGHARRGSDIDLHVFPDAEEALERHVAERWIFERDEVLIRVPGGFRRFLHLHLELSFPVELSVYPPSEIRVRTRSSTDGKTIDRVSPVRLRARLAADHPALWRDHLLGDLEPWQEPEPHGPFAALCDPLEQHRSSCVSDSMLGRDPPE